VILVAGGTGLLGRRLIPRLTRRGMDVRVLTRDPAAAASLAACGVDVVVGDVRDPSSVRAAMVGVATVVAAAHGFVGPRGISPATVDRDGNGHLIDAAAQTGVDVVLMSVVSASPDSPMELMRMKYAAEQHLRAGNTPWTIVRPTAFAELWIGLMRETASKGGRPLVFGRGERLINFVAVDDVAALVDIAVGDASTRGEVLEIGGPEDLTFNQLAAMVQEAEGRTASPRNIPRPILHLMANTVGLAVPQMRRQALSALALDSTDRPFDAAAIHDRFPALPSTRVADLLAPEPTPAG
jgi:uncharacterized protein YbjT (DUF2867 family)